MIIAVGCGLLFCGKGTKIFAHMQIYVQFFCKKEYKKQKYLHMSKKCCTFVAVFTARVRHE